MKKLRALIILLMMATALSGCAYYGGGYGYRPYYPIYHGYSRPYYGYYGHHPRWDGIHHGYGYYGYHGWR